MGDSTLYAAAMAQHVGVQHPLRRSVKECLDVLDGLPVELVVGSGGDVPEVRRQKHVVERQQRVSA